MKAHLTVTGLRTGTAFDLKPTDPKANQASPVTATAFNQVNGCNIFAYAVSYDWAHGYKGNFQGHPNKISLHALKVGWLVASGPESRC